MLPSPRLRRRGSPLSGEGNPCGTFLPGGSQGGEGAAVEGVVQSDNLVSAPLLAVLAGYLDSALVGLGAELQKKAFAMPEAWESSWARAVFSGL